jgi:hypothetical protein
MKRRRLAGQVQIACYGLLPGQTGSAALCGAEQIPGSTPGFPGSTCREEDHDVIRGQRDSPSRHSSCGGSTMIAKRWRGWQWVLICIFLLALVSLAPLGVSSYEKHIHPVRIAMECVCD